MDAASYLKIAKDVLAERHPQAQCAFVSGSVMRGEGRPGSDIDVVVLYDEQYQTPHRDSLIVQGVPIELFVQCPKSLAYIFEREKKSTQPKMPHMIATGTVFGHNLVLAERIQAEARQLIVDGPAPLTYEALKNLQYAVCDILDDLRDERPVGQRLGILAQLFIKLAELHLSSNRQWGCSSKYIVSKLAELDKSLSVRYVSAFQAAFAGDSRALFGLAEEILAPHGGYYFSGHKTYMSDDWKK